MKNIKFTSPQVIQMESTHTSNIKDALLECALMCKKYDIGIDLHFCGYLFEIDKESDLNMMLRDYDNYLNNEL